MSRRARVLKRPVISPDGTFDSVLVSRLINRVMLSGKKTTANNIVIKSLKGASEELQATPTEVLERAVENVKPKIETKGVRVGGSNYQVPMEPYPARALRLSLTWIVNGARDMKGKSMEEKLRSVLIQSYNEEGPAIAKRDVVHQQAASNKAFAHLANRVKRKKK